MKGRRGEEEKRRLTNSLTGRYRFEIPSWESLPRLAGGRGGFSRRIG
jgi:hypothetical protein